MPLTMSRLSTKELLNTAKPLYQKLKSRKEKSLVLLKLKEITGYKSVKSLIRKFSTKQGEKKKKRRGRPPLLTPKDLVILKDLWLLMDQPCGKHLKAMIPDWIDPWQKENKKLPLAQQSRLLQASSATLDRYLKPLKINSSKNNRTRNANGLKAQIPLIDPQRKITKLGYMYADTVAHCGTSLRGSFAWTLTLTEDLTQWTLTQAVWNKGQLGVCSALDKMLSQLPFKPRGINTDNGSEFINYHLQKYLQEKCKVTRSRPMKKNDNARAEEKNRHKVRDLIGYDRLDDERFVDILNDIYRSHNLLSNHFIACTRVIFKKREENRIVKKSDTAQTPYLRTLAEMKPSKKKEKFENSHNQLNPLELRRKVETGLLQLYALLQEINLEE